MIKEFRNFIMRGNVLDLAVAVIMGVAFGAVVNSFVNDIIMPVIGIVLPGRDWRTATLNLGPAKLLVGDFVGAALDFLIIACVVFLIVKWVMKEEATQKR